jgi:hypothetical protein
MVLPEETKVSIGEKDRNQNLDYSLKTAQHQIEMVRKGLIFWFYFAFLFLFLFLFLFFCNARESKPSYCSCLASALPLSYIPSPQARILRKWGKLLQWKQ